MRSANLILSALMWFGALTLMTVEGAAFTDVPDAEVPGAVCNLSTTRPFPTHQEQLSLSMTASEKSRPYS